LFQGNHAVRVAQDDRALHNVLQFANVVGEIVMLETTADLNNVKPEDDPEDTEEFTPVQQQLGSHGGSDAVGEITEFKSKEAVEISTPATPKTESLKNRQTPSQADNPDVPNKNPGDTAHKANVKIVRDGDKITKIIVVCNYG
jgi:hypothetical protein